MHVGKNMMNIPRETNQDKTSMSKGPLKKFTNLNSFLIVKQGNKRIMSSIYINKTKNIGFSSNAKILTKEADEKKRTSLYFSHH